MAKKEFPVILSFAKTKIQKTLNSEPELQQWLAEEIPYWQSFITGGGYDPHIRTNLEIIQSFSNAIKTNLDAAVLDLEQRYVPAFSVREFISKVKESKPNNDEVAQVTLSEIIAPGGLAHYEAPSFTSARTLATVFREYGSYDRLNKSSQDALQNLQKLNTEQQNVTSEIHALIDKLQTDWDTRVAGLEKQAALQAPRRYWTNRNRVHLKEAHKAYCWWLLMWVATLAAIVAAGMFGNFKSFVGTGSDVEKAFTLLAHLAFIGTILGFWVWMMKQKLKEIRSHEHLAEDAAERVTMIDTYSAMHKLGLGTTDLAPILQALYRPATTGLIEDNGPVLPIEILMKGASSVVSRKAD